MTVNGHKKHETELRNEQSAINEHVWDRQRREHAEREHREHARQMGQWKARMKDAGPLESGVPHGLPPKGISSQRVFPKVHEALRQNDPTSKAPSTQPSLPKKAPPTSGRGIPAGFCRAEEPLGSLRCEDPPLTPPFRVWDRPFLA